MKEMKIKLKGNDRLLSPFFRAFILSMCGEGRHRGGKDLSHFTLTSD
ncbi:hypothetical protein CSUI_006317, partial [Cystoisospora suis]